MAPAARLPEALLTMAPPPPASSLPVAPRPAASHGVVPAATADGRRGPPAAAATAAWVAAAVSTAADLSGFGENVYVASDYELHGLGAPRADCFAGLVQQDAE